MTTSTSLLSDSSRIGGLNLVNVVGGSGLHLQLEVIDSDRMFSSIGCCSIDYRRRAHLCLRPVSSNLSKIIPFECR